MKKLACFLTLAVVIIVVLASLEGDVKSSAKYRQSIADEASRHANRADAAYARAWRRVAPDYLSEHQLGVHDARLQEVASNSLTSWNHGVLGAMITGACFESVRDELDRESSSYVTSETARDHLKGHDERVKQLLELGHKVTDARRAALAFKPESEAYGHVDMDTLATFVDGLAASFDAIK